MKKKIRAGSIAEATREVKKAFKKAGEDAVVQTPRVKHRNRLGKKLSADNSLRGPEKHGNYPEHVHPGGEGPYRGVHIQTARPGKEFYGLFFPAITDLSERSCGNRSEVQWNDWAAAGFWDVVSLIDPTPITAIPDILDLFNGQYTPGLINWLNRDLN